MGARLGRVARTLLAVSPERGLLVMVTACSEGLLEVAQTATGTSGAGGGGSGIPPRPPVELDRSLDALREEVLAMVSP